MTGVKCPFYGASLVFLRDIGADSFPISWADSQPLSPHLVTHEGNRCALVTSAHAPCIMAVEGIPVLWRECNRNPEVNGSYVRP